MSRDAECDRVDAHNLEGRGAEVGVMEGARYETSRALLKLGLV